MTDTLRTALERIAALEPPAALPNYRYPQKIARAALAAAPQPASKESTRSENQLWADIYGDTAPQSIPVDREALVKVIREARHKWICDDADGVGDDQDHTIADALLARGLRLPHVSETPESGHEAADVLTPAAQRRARQMSIFPDSSRVVEGGDDA